MKKKIKEVWPIKNVWHSCNFSPRKTGERGGDQEINRFEKLIPEIFQNLWKMSTPTLKYSINPKQNEYKENKLRHIILKLLKQKDKKRIFKQQRERKGTLLSKDFYIKYA